jgi:integral membrane protein
MVDMGALQKLRVLSVVEGVSTLVLFFGAMPLKYLADLPIAVRVVGSIHGFLFVLLLAALVLAVERVPLARRTAVLGAMAAVIPFGPFVFDRRLAALAAERGADELG